MSAWAALSWGRLAGRAGPPTRQLHVQLSELHPHASRRRSTHSWIARALRVRRCIWLYLGTQHYRWRSRSGESLLRSPPHSNWRSGLKPHTPLKETFTMSKPGARWWTGFAISALVVV